MIGKLFLLLCTLLFITFFNFSEERIGPIQKREVSGDYYDCASDIKPGDPGQFNWIMLLSVQGSGNTWTRQLLQSMTGYYAGGVYREIEEEFDTDELFEQSPFPGEHFPPESGRVLGKCYSE